MFDKFVTAADRAIRRTSTDQAPVAHRRRRGRALPKRRRRDGAARRHPPRARARAGAARGRREDGVAHRRGSARRLERIERDFNVLDRLDMTQRLDPKRLRHRPRASAGTPQSCCSGRRMPRASRRFWSSRAGTRPARAARSGASPAALDARDYQVIADQRAHRRGEGQALSVALLAASVARRPDHDLRSQLVRPRARRARRRVRHRGRVAARLRRDQALRGAAGRARHPARQVLDPHHQGRAAPPVPGPPAHRAQALEDHRRGLAQSRPLGRLHAGGERDGRAHEHAGRAVDARRRQRQELRAHQGAQDARRSVGAAAEEDP